MKIRNAVVALALVTSLATIPMTVMVTSAPAQAGLLDSMLNSDLKEVEPTANYEISTYGFDSRVYEWTPAHNPNISCVFVASNESSGVSCYPKAPE